MGVLRRCAVSRARTHFDILTVQYAYAHVRKYADMVYVLLVSIVRTGSSFPSPSTVCSRLCSHPYIHKSISIEGTEPQRLITSYKMPPKVAIVGGGISGAVAASCLGEAGYDVTVFDQGQRGPGILSSS